MRRVGGALVVLVVGCSFESASSQDPAFNPDEGTTAVQGSSGEVGSSTTNVGSGTDAGSTSAEAEASSTPSTTGPSEETGEPGTTTTSSGDVDTADETGAGIDCGAPRVFSVLAEDAELASPMQLGEYMSVTYAYSEMANEGEAVFTFEVDCPSMYRLFARVRDDDPGTSNCCDPDSFVVQGPGGVDTSWFYGCDTTAEGWNWVPVESGQAGQTCDDTVSILVPLTPGTHQFTLRNRESNYFDAVAGVAELVLTNDPDYMP